MIIDAPRKKIGLLLIGVTSFMHFSCNRHLYLHREKSNFYEVNTNVVADSSMNAFLHPYKISVDTQMKLVIGRTDIMLTKAQPESSLGNFMADAQLAAAQKIDKNVQLSVLNYGGIRLPYIAAGAITKEKIYELMPFDNRLTIVELSGKEVAELCQFMAAAKGWPISGFSFKIKDQTAVDIRVGDAPLQENLMYKLALSDYLANGGDKLEIVRNAKRKMTSIYIRDALITYITDLTAKSQPLHPVIENRISYAE